MPTKKRLETSMGTRWMVRWYPGHTKSCERRFKCEQEADLFMTGIKVGVTVKPRSVELYKPQNTAVDQFLYGR